VVLALIVVAVEQNHSSKIKDLNAFMQGTVVYEGSSPTVPLVKDAKGEHLFVCGPIKTLLPCVDIEFNVSTEQPWLKRTVETYMWRETNKV